MINFNIPNLSNTIDDKAYFSIGKVDPLNHNELVVSASFMKMVYEKDLYEILLKSTLVISFEFVNKYKSNPTEILEKEILLIKDMFDIGKVKISEELQYIFNLGSAFHCFCLESKHFKSRYYVSDYKNEYGNKNKNKDYINTGNMDFIIKAYANIKLKYPHILEESHFNEVVLTTNFNGVPYRCKIDKIIETDNEIQIIDLKSVWFDFYSKKFGRAKDGIRWGLIKYIKELNYDLQAYCYTKAVSSWIEHKKVVKNVVFKFLLASKETSDVKMITVSSEMMQSGKEKYSHIFPEIQSFYENGLDYVEKDEII